MTTKTTKKTTGTNVTKFAKAATPSGEVMTAFNPNHNIVTLTLAPETAKALTTLAAAILFAAPAFATQATPQNIVSLSDMFFKYLVGNITVTQPSDEVGQAPVNTNGATFG